MNNIYKLMVKAVALTVAAMTLSSCLEKYPGDYILEEESLKSFEEAEQHLTGIYTSLMSGSLYGGLLTILPDIQCDLVYAVNGNSNNFVPLWQWNIRSTDSEIESIYAGLYVVIGRCNFYLDQVEELKKTLVDDVELEYIDYYTGEVYCARALAYSELVRLYCKAYDETIADEPESGVVLKTSYFTDQPAKRATLRESYQLILDDLAKAEELLDEDNDSYNAAYFTNAAAHAIHARVALYMQDWDSAIEESTRLIESDSFALSSVNSASPASGMSMFDYMWNYDSGYEIIWRLGYTSTSYGYSTGQSFLTFNNDYTYYYPDFVPSESVLNLYASADYRSKAYFATLQTGYSHGLAYPLLVKYYGNQDLIALNIYHVNMPKPLRLAEQYLIRAEAYCRKASPNYGAASSDLSTLRSNRFMTGGSISVNESNWQTTISEERVRELYMEGFRLHDLKRWNMGFERKPQNQSLSEGISLKIEKGDPLFVWPIPRHEIEAPGSEIKPNESN